MKFGVIFVILLLSTLGCAKYFNNLFEGDIAIRDDDHGDDDTRDAFLRSSSQTWAYNTVPYYIDERSIRNESHREFIKEVIRNIQDSAKCIIFEDISDKEKKTGDHIKITAHGDDKNSGDGCWSYGGKQGGEQVINLAEDCMQWGEIAHEVLHALGQVHEHNRPDRDKYIKINMDNVKIGKKKNFEKRKKGSGQDEIVFIDAKYDFYSLLHYPSTAWSKDENSETITPINTQYKEIGGTGGMTATDIIELNLRYECTDIAIPIVIDYIHEVENRIEKEVCDLEVKLEAKFEAKVKNLESKLLNFELKKGDPQCGRPYKILSDSWRMVEYGVPHTTFHCDKTGFPYSTQFKEGWHVFKFDSRYATIPTTPPAEENRQKNMKTCGTYISSWSPSVLPTIGQPPRDITFHFSFLSSEIQPGWSCTGKIGACQGEDGQNMFIYYLPQVKHCNSGYCAI